MCQATPWRPCHGPHVPLSLLRRAGGGAVEAALSVYLEAFATTLGSREQLAIAEAADALLVIPKTLAVNAAKDATELARRPASGASPVC
jgi:chaperonin GroEL (HSP60 family)